MSERNCRNCVFWEPEAGTGMLWAKCGAAESSDGEHDFYIMGEGYLETRRTFSCAAWSDADSDIRNIADLWRLWPELEFWPATRGFRQHMMVRDPQLAGFGTPDFRWVVDVSGDTEQEVCAKTADALIAAGYPPRGK